MWLVSISRQTSRTRFSSALHASPPAKILTPHVVREGLPSRSYCVFDKNQDPAATAFHEDICQRGIIGSKSIAGENHAMFEGYGNIEVVAIHEILRRKRLVIPFTGSSQPFFPESGGLLDGFCSIWLGF